MGDEVSYRSRLSISIDGFEALSEEVGEDNALRILRDQLAVAGDLLARHIELKRKTGKFIRVDYDVNTGQEVLHIDPDEP